MPNSMTECPAADDGTAIPLCAGTNMPGVNICVLICTAPGEQSTCPTGMCCEPIPNQMLGACTWGGNYCDGGSDTGSSSSGSDKGSSGTAGSESGSDSSGSTGG